MLVSDAHEGLAPLVEVDQFAGDTQVLVRVQPGPGCTRQVGGSEIRGTHRDAPIVRTALPRIRRSRRSTRTSAVWLQSAVRPISGCSRPPAARRTKVARSGLYGAPA